jgi:hypothetical protein
MNKKLIVLSILFLIAAIIYINFDRISLFITYNKMKINNVESYEMNLEIKRYNSSDKFIIDNYKNEKFSIIHSKISEDNIITEEEYIIDNGTYKLVDNIHIEQEQQYTIYDNKIIVSGLVNINKISNKTKNIDTIYEVEFNEKFLDILLFEFDIDIEDNFTNTGTIILNKDGYLKKIEYKINDIVITSIYSKYGQINETFKKRT